MNTIDNIRERYQQVRAAFSNNALAPLAQNAFESFNRSGVPTTRDEEWKYTRIASLFNKDFQVAGKSSVNAEELDAIRLPGHEDANELVFVNGLFVEELSRIRSANLHVSDLKEAAENENGAIVYKHLGHSSRYLKDGVHALNTAFVKEGMFIQVKRGKTVEHPVYIYHITDARSANIFSQPRTLVHIGENAQVQLVENHIALGSADSFINLVIEIVVEKDARVEYYKIQDGAPQNNEVSTTHFRQVGKSLIHAVTISLNGGIIRNNINIAMEAEHSEAHLYGLYFLRGQTHVDNHTVVDNVKPNCLSNELYKGVVDDKATAVFNGKIFVRPQAQKTNAFQSNKNILLSDHATVNTKPQLEIFADDVKCSHGCTVGQLDEDGLFYLQSRGISKKIAKSLLVHAFAIDILDHIRLEAIRDHIDQLISQRLEFDIA